MSVRAARKFVRQAVSPVEWTSSRLADIELATSEMSTNAVEYGEGSSFAVTVLIHPGRLDLMVQSAGSHHTPAVQMSGNSTLSGRGLRIVSTVAEQFSVEQSPERVIVSCTFLRDRSQSELDGRERTHDATRTGSGVGAADPDVDPITGARLTRDDGVNPPTSGL